MSISLFSNPVDLAFFFSHFYFPLLRSPSPSSSWPLFLLHFIFFLYRLQFFLLLHFLLLLLLLHPIRYCTPFE